MDTTTPPVSAPAAEVSKDAKTFGMLCHIAALAGFVIPLGNILGPLIVWLIKKNEMPFVDDQGKEALNFQITVFIAMLVCIPLCFIVIGIPLLFVVGIGSLVLAVMAAIKANDGIAYRYPFALRLIK
jgi:uncharacterized protein